MLNGEVAQFLQRNKGFASPQINITRTGAEIHRPSIANQGVSTRKGESKFSHKSRRTSTTLTLNSLMEVGFCA